IYSTYLGGSRSESGSAIAVDAFGSAYVTGFTDSPDFPTTPGAFDRTLDGGEDAFVTKLDPSGSTLVYSTFLGGTRIDSASDIAVDATGSVYVTGATSSTDFPTSGGAFRTNGGAYDAFVTKLNPEGTTLAYSTYLGGTLDDRGRGIVVDTIGAAYV